MSRRPRRGFALSRAILFHGFAPARSLPWHKIVDVVGVGSTEDDDSSLTITS